MKQFDERAEATPNSRAPRGARGLKQIQSVDCKRRLLVAVSRYYLMPALDAARGASPGEKKQLAAVSALLLAIVLFIVVVGLLLVLRYAKVRFSRRPDHPGVKTQYTDAWAESGRRFSQRRPEPRDPAG